MDDVGERLKPLSQTWHCELAFRLAGRAWLLVTVLLGVLPGVRLMLSTSAQVGFFQAAHSCAGAEQRAFSKKVSSWILAVVCRWHLLGKTELLHLCQANVKPLSFFLFSNWLKLQSD